MAEEVPRGRTSLMPAFVPLEAVGGPGGYPYKGPRPTRGSREGNEAGHFSAVLRASFVAGKFLSNAY